MSSVITLTGDYGYTAYKFPSGSTADEIDASSASWIEANLSSTLNLYPFQVSGAHPGLIIKGGTINGQVPQDTDWTVTYVNSAGVRVADAPGALIEGWRISRPWDGIRVVGASDNFTISDVWISDSRDDAIEDDDALGGTIKNSLFDGVMSGISLGDGDVDGSQNKVTIDHVLLRSKSFLYQGEMTHGSPFKMNRDSPDITPSLSIHDSIIAIEDVDHNGQARLAKAWEKTTDASGNYFLNLSDHPFASDYPLPGKGWTILQGQAARDYWEAARSKWIDTHNGSDPTPPTAGKPVAFSNPADANPAVNQIAETAAKGTLVGITASAKDPDAGDHVTYSVNDDRFAIDASGIISRSDKGTLAGAEPSIALTVTATSTDGSKATQQMAVAVIADQPTTSPGTDTHVTEVRVVASADDVEQRGTSGKIYSSSSDLELVNDGSVAQTVGIRFTGVNIPHDAVVTRAYVQFQVDEQDSGTTRLVIHGQDVDNAGAFSTTAYDVSSRQGTDAAVTWTPSEWTTVGAHGTAQRTADISSIVQEIVDRSGWVNGKALALIISGTGERTAEAYDGDRAAAPLLHVEWTSPSAPAMMGPAVALIEGTSGADTLSGTANADIIRGLAGADLISGKAGNDILTGGLGKDTFIFDTQPGAGNHDTVTDFVAGYDRLDLDNAVFAKLGSGSMNSPQSLNSSYFAVGTSHDANDYVVYHSDTGAVTYDADGSGASNAVEIANIGKGLDVSHADFFIV